jgi:hypothetical protein
MPGDNFARGSLTSEPVMPVGSGGAGCGANGLAGAAGVADGAGDGEVVCANVFAAKHEHKTTKATNNWKVAVRTRFIVFPLKVFPATALPKKSAAMPSDVRKAFGLPATDHVDFGLCPVVGA